MPSLLTEITEIATALGTLGRPLDASLRCRPAELRNVPDPVWERLVAADRAGDHADVFATAMTNGAAFLDADDGLRGRRPRLVEWKGPHRPPGADAIPADIRVDHVYLISCKYLSKVLVNAGPVRLFDGLLADDRRAGGHWFDVTAPDEFRAFYAGARAGAGGTGLPDDPLELTAEQQQRLRRAVSDRVLPAELRPAWSALCHRVSVVSAERWRTALATPRSRLLLLWRLLRVSNSTYYVLGTDGAQSVRLRVGSTWDWHQRFDLRSLDVEARVAGQPEVGWRAAVRDRATGAVHDLRGHVEVRWSHGRFVGTPEAKVYLDIPHADIPGYEPLSARDGPAYQPALHHEL